MKLVNARIKYLKRGLTLYVIREGEIVDHLYITHNSHYDLGFEAYSYSKGVLMWLPYEEVDFDILFCYR